MTLCPNQESAWWETGGDTNIGNGVPLCLHHHHLVHEGGWQITYSPTTGMTTLTGPAGHHHQRPLITLPLTLSDESQGDVLRLMSSEATLAAPLQRSEPGGEVA